MIGTFASVQSYSAEASGARVIAAPVLPSGAPLSGLRRSPVRWVGDDDVAQRRVAVVRHLDVERHRRAHDRQGRLSRRQRLDDVDLRMDHVDRCVVVVVDRAARHRGARRRRGVRDVVGSDGRVARVLRARPGVSSASAGREFLSRLHEAGNLLSDTVMFVRFESPVFFTTIVYVTVSPAWTTGLLTSFVIRMLGLMTSGLSFVPLQAFDVEKLLSSPL